MPKSKSKKRCARSLWIRNHKVLLNDIKKDPNERGQEIYHSKDINYPKLTYIFTQIPIIVPPGFFKRAWQAD